jgi:hypothetical protein
VKRARGRRTETRSHPHFIAAMIRRRVSIPARRKGRAGVFPLLREPTRATRRRPEIAPSAPAQPSSGETNPSRVSPQPGCGVPFGRGWPGPTSGQGRKHARLQPMGARPTSSTLTNMPQVLGVLLCERLTARWCGSHRGWGQSRAHRSLDGVDAPDTGPPEAFALRRLRCQMGRTSTRGGIDASGCGPESLYASTP